MTSLEEKTLHLKSYVRSLRSIVDRPDDNDSLRELENIVTALDTSTVLDHLTSEHSPMSAEFKSELCAAIMFVSDVCNELHDLIESRVTRQK